MSSSGPPTCNPLHTYCRPCHLLLLHAVSPRFPYAPSARCATVLGACGICMPPLFLLLLDVLSAWRTTALASCALCLAPRPCLMLLPRPDRLPLPHGPSHGQLLLSCTRCMPPHHPWPHAPQSASRAASFSFFCSMRPPPGMPQQMFKRASGLTGTPQLPWTSWLSTPRRWLRCRRGWRGTLHIVTGARGRGCCW